MPIPDKKEVQSILTSDRETRIKQAYHLAWKDWWNSADRQRLSRWGRTRSNNFFEYFADRLIAEFKDDTEARFIFERETFKLVIDEKLVIRFKKSNSNGVGSNIGTQAELDFCDPQTWLPGLPGLQKVEIVYSLNVTQTAIDQITVLARDGGRRLWNYHIASTGGATVIPLMQTKSPISDIDIDQIVMPKKDGKQAEGSDT